MMDDCKWRDDLEVRINRDLGLPCGMWRHYHPKCLRLYKLTGKLSAGRRIFKHTNGNRILMIVNENVDWDVKDNVSSKEAWMHSACAPSMCPADIRAHYSSRFSQTSWEYWSKNEMKPGNITVKCSVHSK